MTDVVLLVFFSAVLLTLSYFQSRDRMFWGDEIMGSYVLNSGSWHRFLELWHGGIDSSGFWFYALGKPWEWVFGSTEVSLRMFSGFGIAISATLIWLAARRFYAVPVVALAVAFPFLDLDVLRWQLCNGRCYGVLMASTALVLYLMVRGSDEAHRKPSFRFLVATCIAYDVLAGSHILGMLFAFALLAMQIALDLRTRSVRPKLYVTAAVGICGIVLFSLQNIRSTTALGKPVFWTQKPLLRSFWLASDVTGGPVRWILVGLLLLSAVVLNRRLSRDLVYLLLAGFLLLHSTILLISFRTTSIYVDRYLLPLTFGLVFLIAELLTQIRESRESSRWRYVLVCVVLAAFALQNAPRQREGELPLRNYTDRLLAELPSGLPVVDTDVGTFVEAEFYKHGHFGRPFLFPLDAAVTANANNPGGVSGFHEMDNFKAYGLDAPDLQTTQVILATYPDFVVITAPTPTSWFRMRVQDSNRYEVTNLGAHSFGGVDTQFWRVRRR